MYLNAEKDVPWGHCVEAMSLELELYRAMQEGVFQPQWYGS